MTDDAMGCRRTQVSNSGGELEASYGRTAVAAYDPALHLQRSWLGRGWGGPVLTEEDLVAVSCPVGGGLTPPRRSER